MEELEERSGLGRNKDGGRKGKSGTGEQMRTNREGDGSLSKKIEGGEGRGVRAAAADSKIDNNIGSDVEDDGEKSSLKRKED